VLQTIWTVFCITRVILILRRRIHGAPLPEWDRESLGFALGGLLSSFLLVTLVALTPIRMR